MGDHWGRFWSRTLHGILQITPSSTEWDGQSPPPHPSVSSKSRIFFFCRRSRALKMLWIRDLRPPPPPTTMASCYPPPPPKVRDLRFLLYATYWL